MADTQDSKENGFTAPNVKSSWLAEVEADATYITEKRFAEHYEEQGREAAKKQRENAKAAQPAPSADPKFAETQVSSNTASTHTELNAPVQDEKKGK